MKITTSKSYNVFHITPALILTAEKNYRSGGLDYAYLSICWGFWSIDLVLKDQVFEDDPF